MSAIELTRYETLQLVFDALVTIGGCVEDCEGKSDLGHLHHELGEIGRLAMRARQLIEAHEPMVNNDASPL